MDEDNSDQRERSFENAAAVAGLLAGVAIIILMFALAAGKV